MFKLTYDINFEKVIRVKLDACGLTGRESPDSLKDALMYMSIENPCVTFSRNVKEGNYQMRYNLSETASIAEACNYLSDLWQHDYVKGSLPENLCIQMTPLRLLENACTLLLIQQSIIDELKRRNKK